MPAIDQCQQQGSMLCSKRAGIVVAARGVEDTVFIDEDITDRPLVHEPVRAAIPAKKSFVRTWGKALR